MQNSNVLKVCALEDAKPGYYNDIASNIWTGSRFSRSAWLGKRTKHLTVASWSNANRTAWSVNTKENNAPRPATQRRPLKNLLFHT